MMHRRCQGCGKQMKQKGSGHQEHPQCKYSEHTLGNLRYHFTVLLQQHWICSWNSPLVTVWVKDCVDHEETGDREGGSVKVTRKVSHWL